MKRNAFWYFLIVVIAFTSCKTQNLLVEKNTQSDKKLIDSIFHFDPTYQYKIRVNDKISISVWGQDELSVGSLYGIYNSNEVYGKWLMVDIQGNIEIPKLGTTKVLDLSVVELKELLKSKFSTWILNPIVDVKVLNKEISILGEVRNPNTFTIDKDYCSLLEITSKAGGFEFYANIKKVKILRQEGSNVRITNIDLTKGKDYLAKNILLHPGDLVIVPSKAYKEFDKRVSTIIPFTTTISAAAILLTLF